MGDLNGQLGDALDGTVASAAYGLSAADVMALDALVEAGWDASRISDAALAARARHVAHLLGIVDAPAAIANRALVDVTFLRATRLPAGGAVPADEQGSLAALLTGGPAFDAGGREDLIARTLAGVERAIDAERDSYRLSTYRESRAGRVASMSIRDIVSVAAVLLIAASVVWPVLSYVRDEGRRTACNSNLGIASTALATYAQDYQYSPPMVAGFSGGTPWWNVGQTPGQSNSANLYTLSREGYVPLAALACPGNSHAQTVGTPEQRDWRSLEEISYSYQIMPATMRVTWGSQDTVVMTDRSPVILRAIRGEPIDPWANSPNHGGRGQHVVMADGSVGWLTQPEIGLGDKRWASGGSAHGDNIWLPRPIERAIDQVTGRRRVDPIKGTEVPESADDAFVGP